MVDAPYNTAAFKVGTYGGAAIRTLDTRFGEIINVKDYGAVGNGSADDTAAIQAALNAAFGTVLNPHGWDGNQALPAQRANKKVFFPAGRYIVQPPIAQSNINAVVVNADGSITYTTSAAHGLSDKQLVWIEGCNNSDPFPWVNGTKFIKPGDFTGLNTATKFTTYATGMYVNGYTPSGRVHVACLQMCAVYGGTIFGSGCKSSIIQCNTPGGTIMHANGWNACSVHDLGFQGPSFQATDGSNGFLFDLDTSGTNIVIPGGVQGIFFDDFYDCNFVTCDKGANISPTQGSQGDTVNFYGCNFIQNNAGADVGRFNFNAININFFGGGGLTNKNCLVSGGGAAMGIVSGMVFAENVLWDIYHFGGDFTTPVVIGCTTESANFMYCDRSQPTIIGCNQRSNASGPGFFLDCRTFPASLEQCMSVKGQVALQTGGLIRNSQFERADALTSSQGKPIFVQNVVVGGTWGGPNSVWNIGFNGGYPYVDGFFIEASGTGSTLYFLGYKMPGSFTGPTPNPPIARMRVGDLPPANNQWCIGRGVVVFDSVKDGSPGNKNTPIGAGAGPNIVEVLSNGTNWMIV